jgi:SAM-dependent methyltransferase
MKAMVPWPVKIAGKIVLARLPVNYRAWKRLGIFEHGAMERPDYSDSVFRGHFSRSGLAGRRGFTCLELGPGDTLFSALIARAHGAAASWLVDVGDFAERDTAPYRGMALHLAAQGLAVPAASAFGSLDDLLADCHAQYLTDGLAALRRLPSASIDFQFSQAVLEHIRRRDFADLVTELRRILRPGGVSSHRIDLRDHLGGALNNLRFPAGLWEADWFARSGFYTNRLRMSEMLATFRDAGFAVDVVAVDRWPALPTPRRHLAAAFRELSDDELLVSGFDVVLRPE